MNEQIGNKVSDKTYINLTPFKGFVLENFPFIEADFDAITNYQLLCKVIEYLNNVISNQNQVQDLGTDLVNAYNSLVDAVNLAINSFEEDITGDFNDLKDYVDNYFDNNFPQMISDKLDEMAEDGTLESLLDDYAHLTKSYNTYTDMIADASTFINGLRLKTLGYYSINDGGGAEYYVSNNVIATNYQIELQNGLYLNLIIKNNTINVLQIGAKGDNLTDNTNFFNIAINEANSNNYIIYIPSGKYIIENTLNNINSGISINGDERSVGITENKTVIIDKRDSENYLINYNNSTLGSSIKNITFEANSTNNSENIKCIHARYGFYMGFIENCDFINYPVAINIEANIVRVNNCQFHLCGGKTNNSSLYAITITNGMDILIENCCSDHCRYIITSIGYGKVKIINSHWEISTALLTAGNSPIRLENSFGATLENNTFVNLSVNAWKEIIGLASQSDVPYMVYITANCYSIFSNNTFLCGTGSGEYETEITNEGKYLRMARGIINSNIFRNCSYVVPSIDYDTNVVFDNNWIQVLLKTDYSYTNKYVINNGGGNGGENNNYFIEMQDTSIDYDFPWLFYYYVKHTISSSGDKYIMKNNMFGHNLSCLTYVFKCNQRPIIPIYVDAQKFFSTDFMFNGLVSLTPSNPVVRQTFYKSLGSGYSLVISYKDNKAYFQFIGSNISNFITSFKGFTGIFGELYLDTSITEQITADNQLIITA